MEGVRQVSPIKILTRRYGTNWNGWTSRRFREGWLILKFSVVRKIVENINLTQRTLKFSTDYLPYMKWMSDLSMQDESELLRWIISQ